MERATSTCSIGGQSGPQSQSGCFWRSEISLPLTWILTPGHPAHSIVSLLTTPPWLSLSLNGHLKVILTAPFTVSVTQLDRTHVAFWCQNVQEVQKDQSAFFEPESYMQFLLVICHCLQKHLMCFHEFLLKLFFICKYSDTHIQGVPGVTVSTLAYNSKANSESNSQRFRSYEYLEYLK